MSVAIVIGRLDADDADGFSGVEVELAITADGRPALLYGRHGVPYEEGHLINRWIEAVTGERAHVLCDEGPPDHLGGTRP